MKLRLVALAAVLLCACSKDAPQATPEPVTTSSGAPLVLAPSGVRIVNAGSGKDASALIRTERDNAKKEGRDLVVYVGAKWCEPCQRFHHAAEAGELDAEFPNLTVMQFDLDEDRDRIVAAGYASTYIPLFVVPGPDGRASAKRVEGGVKGVGAVANLTPKLHALFN